MRLRFIIYNLENQRKTLWWRDSTGLFGQNFLDVYFFENSAYEGCGVGLDGGTVLCDDGLIFYMSLRNLEH